MKIFKDNAQRSWSLSVNIASVKRVKTLLGFDLLDLNDGKMFERLGNDPVLVADVLYVLVKPDADKLGISDEDFGASLGGDAFELATDALIDEVFDFFPQQKRTMLTGLKKKFTNYQDKQLKLAMAKLDNLDDNQIEKILTQSILAATGN